MSEDGLDEAFHSADPDVRRRAVQGMSLRPRGTPLELIVDALSDSDWRVRREAISLASQSAEKDALIDSLLARLVETDNTGLRNAAIEVLGMVAQGQAQKFADALAGAGGGAQKFLVEAMGKTRDPSMIDHLEPLVLGPDGNVAAAAVEALVRIGGSRAEGLLKERLSTPHLFLRISILEGLTRLGTRLTWSELGPAVDDVIVRRISAELLGRTGAPEALEFLLGERDEVEDGRAGLGEHGGHDAPGVRLKHLPSKDAVRVIQAIALRQDSPGNTHASANRDQGISGRNLDAANLPGHLPEHGHGVIGSLGGPPPTTGENHRDEHQPPADCGLNTPK